MNQNNFIKTSNNNTDELIHMIKIGIIRQLHADNLLNDQQYAQLLRINKSEKFDNMPCLQ